MAVRYKGNGTFLSGLHSFRRPFKLELNKHAPSQNLLGRTVVNLHNLEADRSFLSDTLGYEFFRDAGVPAHHAFDSEEGLRRRLVSGSGNGRLPGRRVVARNPALSPALR